MTREIHEDADLVLGFLFTLPEMQRADQLRSWTVAYRPRFAALVARLGGRHGRALRRLADGQWCGVLEADLRAELAECRDRRLDVYRSLLDPAHDVGTIAGRVSEGSRVLQAMLLEWAAELAAKRPTRHEAHAALRSLLWRVRDPSAEFDDTAEPHLAEQLDAGPAPLRARRQPPGW